MPIQGKTQEKPIKSKGRFWLPRPMLNIGKLRRGGENYYLNSVAKGVEDYYLGSGESPGYWMASGAREIGLAGEVQDHQLRAILRGADPTDGTQLVPERKDQRVPGFDLTFRAPKSVALLHALGPKDASNEVVSAHDAAVKAALHYLEDNCSGARRGMGGKTSIASKGLIAAAFRHRVSRSGDPLLHTHVLAANLIQGVDGKWGALDARHLYLHAKTAGYLYQAHLRAELTRRLGIAWQPVRKGAADIEGVSRDVIEAFSKRRREIEHELAEISSPTRREAEVAALATRQAKDYSVSPTSLLPEWKAKAAGLGLTHDALEDLLNRTQQVPVTEKDRDEMWCRLSSPSGLTEGQSTFSTRDAIQSICNSLDQGAEVAQIVSLADEFTNSAHVVPLRSIRDSRDVGFRLSNSPIAAGTREARFTTQDMLDVERTVIERVVAHQGRSCAAVDAVTTDTVLRSRLNLSDEQRNLVTRLTCSGHGVDVVVGKAGSGKTYALRAAREAWEASGYRVIGCSLSARAAKELQAGSGIESGTLARLLMDLDDPRSGGLAAGSVIVVDEAGMVGTRDLARLLDHVVGAGAKLVLVGDHHQLPEIQAGGAFRAIQSFVDPVELDEVRRQPHEWEREALELLRQGRSGDALDLYLDHDRIQVGAKADRSRDRLVSDWWERYSCGSEVVMLAARRSEVRELNRKAREVMENHGRLGGQSLVVGDGEFAAGDRVMVLMNHRRLGVVNSDRGVIQSIDMTAGEVTVALDEGGSVILPRSYLEGGHLTHAYAMTGHKAQGMTTDAALVLGDETLFREWAYVAMSRGREDNCLYAIAADDLDRLETGGEIEASADPLAEVSRAMARSRAQGFATDQATDGSELELSREI